MAKAQVESQEEEVAGASFTDDADGLVVNLANVEAQSFDAIPAGKYPVIIKDITYSKSKSSDKPMWSLQAQIYEGDFENRVLFDILSFSDGALPSTKTKIMALAPELLQGEFNPSKPEIYDPIIGRKFIAQVKIQKGSDEYPDPRNSIQKYLPAEGANAFV